MIGVYLLGLYGMLVFSTTGIRVRLVYIVGAYVAVHFSVNLAMLFVADAKSGVAFYSLLGVGILAGLLGIVSEYIVVSPAFKLRSAAKAEQEFASKYSSSTMAALVIGAVSFLLIPWLREYQDALRTFLPIYLLTIVAVLIRKDVERRKDL
jgi:hypothetical protein